MVFAETEADLGTELLEPQAGQSVLVFEQFELVLEECELVLEQHG